MRILDSLRESIRDTAIYNPEAQIAPCCILWPDKDRQWEASIPCRGRASGIIDLRDPMM